MNLIKSILMGLGVIVLVAIAGIAYFFVTYGDFEEAR